MTDRCVYLHLDAGDITNYLSAAGLDIEVKLGAEGVKVNVWCHPQDDGERLLGTTWKTYDEMGNIFEGVDKREKALDELTKQAQDLDMGY